jgi:hypothetical protein
VSVDLDEVLNALKRDSCDFLVGDMPTSVPPWADWLIWLGQWMRAQAGLPGRRVAIIRMPSRRLSAAFAGLGSTFASARLHDGSLDWERLRSLAPGTKVFWRETVRGNSTRRSGTVAGLRQIENDDFMEVVVDTRHDKALRATRLFAKSAALSYGITLGSVSAAADERLACAERFIAAAVTNGAQGWIRSGGIDCNVISERSSFQIDLEGLSVRVDGTVAATCADVLAIAEPSGRSHGKLRVAPTWTDGILDESGLVTILDGAAAARRLSDTVAQSVVVLLDHAEYDEEIEHLFQTFLDYAVDAHVHPPASGAKAPPDSVECFIFGLPVLTRSNP